VLRRIGRLAPPFHLTHFAACCDHVQVGKCTRCGFAFFYNAHGSSHVATGEHTHGIRERQKMT
jgi:hypothetical protein